MSIFLSLQESGLVQDFSDLEALTKINKGDAFYVGFDPTAVSLQIGNLVPLVASVKLAKAGLKPYILFGGATGAIGDPSGRSTERQLLDRSVIDENIAKQTAQAKFIFNQIGVEPVFVNNFDWTHKIDVLSFLRDIGKHFTVNYMTSKEVVKNRLQGEGISYTEFSYMLLQAYDFYHLYTNHNVRLQIGGSDQWGNMTAGLELIRKKSGENNALSFSIPLVTNSDGLKFGKSASGAVWLDAEKFSPYQFHQFWLNIQDADVIRYLKIFTFISSELIHEHEELVKNQPEKRASQKLLADLVTELVHGSDKLQFAKKSAEVLFGGSIDGINDDELLRIFCDVPSSKLSKESASIGTIVDLLVLAGAIKSKGEAKRLIAGGGVSINSKKIISDATLSKDFLDRSILVVKVGKKNYHLILIEG